MRPTEHTAAERGWLGVAEPQLVDESADGVARVVYGVSQPGGGGGTGQAGSGRQRSQLAS
jgi:hypothetical protein